MFIRRHDASADPSNEKHSASRAARQRTPFSALRHRDFRRVWIAALVSQTGTWLMITGRAFLVYRLTGSEAALGIVYFFSLIPVPLFSQLSGVLVDRFDRRRLLIVSQLLFIVVSIIMGTLAQTERATLANVSAISFVYGTIQALSVPVQQTVVPSLVPRTSLTQAVALQSMINSSSRMFGPALWVCCCPSSGWRGSSI